MRDQRHTISRIALVAGVAVLAASPAVPQQQVLPPIARYTLDAGTVSGMGAMGAGGGGLGAAMAMMRGGNQVAHEMVLRLGSTRTSTGAPKADHFLPTVMRMGKSVPLVTPAPGVAGPATPGTPQQGQMPKARLLLFWGCGEHAPRGQPVVIDFSKLAQGQVPPNLYAKPLNLPDDWTVQASRSTTYGDWPNGRESKSVPANASLLGAHRVTSTYAPEIQFNLQQDFLAPLNPTTSILGSQAVALNWNLVPNATGYYAWAMGAKGDGQNQPTDMVWWSSSSTQQFGGPLADWIAPSTVARLITAKTVMPPTQSTCTIPAEVKAAAGDMLMTTLYGYGPQADFAYPARPTDPKIAWRPEWIARVRYRTNAMVMAGMPAMGGAEQGGQAQGQPSAPANTLPACPRGLAGIAARAAKLCF